MSKNFYYTYMHIEAITLKCFLKNKTPTQLVVYDRTFYVELKFKQQIGLKYIKEN